MPHAYTEDLLVQPRAIGLFAELGWSTVAAWEDPFGAPSPGLADTLSHPMGEGASLGRETNGAVVLVAAILQGECTLPNSLRRATAGGVACATFAENLRNALIY